MEHVTGERQPSKASRTVPTCPSPSEAAKAFAAAENAKKTGTARMAAAFEVRSSTRSYFCTLFYSPLCLPLPQRGAKRARQAAAVKISPMMVRAR